MKKTLMLIAVVTVVATGVSFSLARWLASRPAAVVNLHDPAWLKRELNLTDSQARVVEQAESEFRAKLNAACATHCDARRSLGEEIAQPKPDPDKARALVDKMNAVQAASERETLAHILRIRSLLDAQQAQRYSALIRDQVCNMPMGTP
jgi:Spy/CpxP family protein refolding chaperone